MKKKTKLIGALIVIFGVAMSRTSLATETSSNKEDSIKEAEVVKSNDSKPATIETLDSNSIETTEPTTETESTQPIEAVETTEITESSTSTETSSSEKPESGIDSKVVENEKNQTFAEKNDYDKYVTITNSNAQIYSTDFTWQIIMSTKNLLGKTFQAKGKYELPNKEIYLLLVDNAGNEIGLINKTAVTIGNGKEGAYQNYGKYVTITSSRYTTYSGFDWEQRESTKNMYGKTYLAKGKYQHVNAMTYLSLYDDNGNWHGYVNATATTEADGKQGAYQSYGKYVTVLSSNYTTYSDFSWGQLDSTKNMYGKTYEARGKYTHTNGMTYLSLFDDGGKWYGYVNANCAKVADGRQGAYQSYGKYVTITNNDYATYNDFDWNTRSSTKSMYKKTYQAQGRYMHINGAAYLSLYDGNGNWCGYVNEKATSLADGKQGIYQSYGQYVTITNKNYTTYNDFSWNDRNATKDMYQKTYNAKGKYMHINGATYLSLYDANDKWFGYVNENATQKSVAEGNYIADQHYIKITNKNYDIWQNFKWQKRSNTSNYYGQVMTTRGKYIHFNGATYLSLYDFNGDWVGYLNVNATKKFTPSGEVVVGYWNGVNYRGLGNSGMIFSTKSEAYKWTKDNMPKEYIGYSIWEVRISGTNEIKYTINFESKDK